MKLNAGDRFKIYKENKIIEQIVLDGCEVHVNKDSFLHRIHKPAYSNNLFCAYYIDGRIVTEINIKKESVKYLLKKMKQFLPKLVIDKTNNNENESQQHTQVLRKS